MTRKVLIYFFLICFVSAVYGKYITGNVTYDKYSLIIDGERQFIYSGAFHYWRLPSPSLWRDILEKLKSAGMSATTVYFAWSYHSPKSHLYNFEGVRDIDKLFNVTGEVGLHLISRPGPYINAETNAGGFPGWLVSSLKGLARTDDPYYTAAWEQWLSAVDPHLQKFQSPYGGPIIAVQVENEYDVGNLSAKYMELLEAKFREDGIVVPLTTNVYGDRSTWTSGPGAVDIQGIDSYPQGFDCRNPSQWHAIPTYFAAAHAENNPTEPMYNPEYQGGSFDPWAGPGYYYCYELTNGDFERVFYQNQIAQGETMLNFYMTFGGTTWGWLPFPGVYTSYDYGAAINEGRQLTDKYSEQKLMANFFRVFKPLRKMDSIQVASPTNPTLYLQGRENKDDGTQLYILRHQDGTSITKETTRILVQGILGDYQIPREEGTYILIDRRDSKMLPCFYGFGDQYLVYSTAEMMTHTTVQGESGQVDTAIFYLGEMQYGELMFYFQNAVFEPSIQVYEGQLQKLHWDSSRNQLRINYQQSQVIRLMISSQQRPLYLILASREVAKKWWNIESDDGDVLLSGPYLVRSAKYTDDGGLHLRGDTEIETQLKVLPPKPATYLTWNGEYLENVKHESPLTLVTTLPGPPPVYLPPLDFWKFKYGTPEKEASFDDSDWVTADKNHTNCPFKPITLPVLYMDDYGFHVGDVWFRGRFSSNETVRGIVLTGEGGDFSVYSVWLNGHFLGTAENGTATFHFKKEQLAAQGDNVIAILLENMGHDEDYTNTHNKWQHPRGLVQARLISGCSCEKNDMSDVPIYWKIQGNLRGEEYIDSARGPFNNGGLYGERHGWYLPGFPDEDWEQVILPHRFSEAGVAWYRTTFELNIPEGVDASIGIRIEDTDPDSRYRALIFLNGWMLGHYINYVGPQHFFALPNGILNPRGSNQLSIAVWGQEGGEGLSHVALETYAIHLGGVPVEMVYSPDYKELFL
ncbi:hypothetical protein GpartN1_g3216.t1 [Galdieria partita]|uniref:Beta-galactosidase n=1 Tax=Galdieria partita TaxID=83374 RepID=A0A9C7UQC8_9RHOD|nr:hypothetical protein GpartN1_g3216.t1 [Galdieria partita]